MRKMTSIILVLVIVLLSYKGWILFKKYKNSKKLSVGIAGFKIPKLNLSNLVGEIPIAVKVAIDNFSSSKFTLNQLKIDALDENGDLIAYQENPLSDSVKLLPNQKNEVIIRYKIAAIKLKELVKSSGGILSVSTSYLTSGQYGIPIHLKGFVEAENITIEVDEKMTI